MQNGIRDTAAERDARLPDIDWAVPPAGATRSWIDAPSGRLAMLTAGERSGQRVLLVPGATGSKEDFWFQIPELAAAGYRVESVDLAGQYESRDAGPEHLSPPRAAYDWDLFAADLIAVLEAGSTPVHLVGYSFAGLLAEQVAVARPELVASLTLLSTPPLAGQVFRGVRLLGPLSGVAPARLIAALMKAGIVVNVQDVPPGRLRFVRARFRLTRAASHREVVALMKRTPDVLDRLAFLPMPRAVAVGAADLWPLRQHRRFASRIGASIAVYRTGHSPCETAPYQLTRDLLALFEKALQSS